MHWTLCTALALLAGILGTGCHAQPGSRATPTPIEPSEAWNQYGRSRQARLEVRLYALPEKGVVAALGQTTDQQPHVLEGDAAREHERRILNQAGRAVTQVSFLSESQHYVSLTMDVEGRESIAVRATTRREAGAILLDFELSHRVRWNARIPGATMTARDVSFNGLGTMFLLGPVRDGHHLLIVLDLEDVSGC